MAPFWTPKKSSELADMLASGLSYVECGRRLSCNASTVANRANQLRASRETEGGDGKTVTALQSKIRRNKNGLLPALTKIQIEDLKAASARRLDCANQEAPAALESGCQLEDLKQGQCHWPIGDVGTPEFHFCGANVPGIGSYCPFHANIAFRPGTNAALARELRLDGAPQTEGAD